MFCSPGLNPIKNLWNILKRNVYVNRCQFIAIMNFALLFWMLCSLFQREKYKRLTKEKDEHLLKLVSKQGAYIFTLNLSITFLSLQWHCFPYFCSKHCKHCTHSANMNFNHNIYWIFSTLINM